jgi:hypothetical protein
MPRIATTRRPPILTSLFLLGAVATLGPPTHPMCESLGPAPAVVVAGESKGDLYVPPSIDSWILQTPPRDTVAMPNVWSQHDLGWRPTLAPLRIDEWVSDFVRRLAGTPA